MLPQVVARMARMEAWNVCVRATGATVTRRLLFRAAGVGYLASGLTGSLGIAARIASLRRVAPHAGPGVPALLAPKFRSLASKSRWRRSSSFTLIGPLGAPGACSSSPLRSRRLR
jgi:hypothetical protein